MRVLLLFTIFLSALLEAYAQPLISSPIGFDASTHFDREHVLAMHARTVRVQTTPLNKARPDIREEEVLLFDVKGNLSTRTVLRQQDTLLIETYQYTEKGQLGVVIRYEKPYQRRYKYVYRFNTDKTPFQVKSYELLAGDESLLLDTRYFAHEAGKLQQSQRLENRQLSETCRYEYDKAGRLVRQTCQSNQGEILQNIAYAYNGTGQLLSVLETGNGRNEYRYSYDEAGRILSVQWMQDGLLKGEQAHVYGSGGRLLETIRTTQGGGVSENYKRAYLYE